MSTAVGWAPITKSEKRADGTLIITGRAASSAVDRDHQIADEAWLDKALGRWFSEPDGGNVREQHDGKRAVGTALTYKADNHEISAHIVDPVTVLKIENNVLKGFSWSARNARVKMDKAAAGGRIVDGQIYEVSVVDRPANPECLFTVAKADGAGDLQIVEQPEFVEVDAAKADGELVDVIEKGDDSRADVTVSDGLLTAEGKRVTPSYVADLMKALGKNPAPVQKAEDEDGKAGDADEKQGDAKPQGHQPARYKAGENDNVKCPSCNRMNAPDAKHCDQCGDRLKGKQGVEVDGKDDGDGESEGAEKADLPMFGEELSKFVSADKRREYADAGIAMPSGDFPIPDEGHLKSAVGHLGTYKGDKAAAKRHIIKRAKALGKTNLLPDEWGVSKAFAAVEALRAQLGVAGITVSKVDAEAAMQENEDVAGGKAAIAAIARLIISEAEELAEGHLCEIDDICTLICAAQSLRCFIAGEADEIGSHTVPADSTEGASAMKSDAANDDTTETTADDQPADTTTTSKTEAAPAGVLTEEKLSELLKSAATEAVQPYKDELAATKGELDTVKADLAKVLETPRTDGPARTRTTTHTAVAAKADTLRTEIARLDVMIGATAGDIQKGYRERKEETEAELNKLQGAAA